VFVVVDVGVVGCGVGAVGVDDDGNRADQHSSVPKYIAKPSIFNNNNHKIIKAQNSDQHHT